MIWLENLVLQDRAGRRLGPLNFRRDGGLVVLRGHNGSGTTTLLRALAGLEHSICSGRLQCPENVGFLPTHTALRDEQGTAALDRVLASSAQLLLLDQPLATLPGQLREQAAERIAAAAQEGRTVLWAEHLDDETLGRADIVLQLTESGLDEVTDYAQLGPLAAGSRAWLGRRLHAPFAAVRTPESLAEVLADAGLEIVRRPAARRTAPVLHRIPMPDLRLSGGYCEIATGDVVGVVADDPTQAAQTARLLCRQLRGQRLDDCDLDTLCRVRGGRGIARAIDSQRGWPRGTAARKLAETLGDAPWAWGNTASDGQAQLLRQLAALLVDDIGLLIEPSCYLDPENLQLLERALASTTGPTIVASRDLDWVVDHCTQVLVLDGDGNAEFGALSAVRSWPAQPWLARVAPQARAMSLREVDVVQQRSA